MQIELHTQGLTADSLDHDGTIPAERMAEAIGVYIEIALAALRAAYPAAEVDTAPGNGITSFEVWDDDTDTTRWGVEEVLGRVYEDWCQTIYARLGLWAGRAWRERERQDDLRAPGSVSFANSCL